MRVTLNLATRPYADQGPAIKQLRIGMAVLVVILGGLIFGLMHFHQAAVRAAADQEVVDQSIARIQQEEVGYQRQMQQPDNAKVLTQARFLNQLFDEKSFSWTAALEDLERVLPAGVQVTAIEPVRDKNGELTLRLRISGPREKSIETIRNMEHSRRFVSPRTSGENAENNANQNGVQQVSGPGKVSFEVLSEYSQATLEERKAAIAAQKAAGPKRPVSSAAVAPGARTARPPAAVQPGLPAAARSLAPRSLAPRSLAPRSTRPVSVAPDSQDLPVTGLTPTPEQMQRPSRPGSHRHPPMVNGVPVQPTGDPQ